jgi:hypothetical protein
MGFPNLVYHPRSFSWAAWFSGLTAAVERSTIQVLVYGVKPSLYTRNIFLNAFSEKRLVSVSQDTLWPKAFLSGYCPDDCPPQGLLGCWECKREESDPLNHSL